MNIFNENGSIIIQINSSVFGYTWCRKKLEVTTVAVSEAPFPVLDLIMFRIRISLMIFW